MKEIYKANVEQRQVGTDGMIRIINFFTRIGEFLTGTRRKGELVEYENSIVVTSTVYRFWFFKGDESVLVMNKGKISAASTSYSKRLGGSFCVVTLYVGGLSEPQGYALKDTYDVVSEKIRTWVHSAET